MEFRNESQKAIYERITPMLKDLFGGFVVAHPEEPTFGIRMGSAFANISVTPWGEHDATVNVRAWVVMGAESAPELMKYLLQKNNHVVFGSFGMDEQGDVFFQHTLVGPTCDKPELSAAVLAVVTTANELDDEIVSRWGGQRAQDTRD